MAVLTRAKGYLSRVYNAFAARSPPDAALAAYQKIEQHFAAVQAGLSRYDVLKATKWVSDGAVLDGTLKDIMELRRDLYKRLNDPALPGLLAVAGAETSRLSDWQKSNLRLMERITGQVTRIGDMNFIESLEDSMAGTEQLWLKTLDMHETLQEEKDAGLIDEAAFEARRREIFEKHQVPLFSHAFDMRRAACEGISLALKIPPSQVMLDYWNPYEKTETVEKTCAEIEKRFPAVVKKLQSHLAQAPAAQTLPPVELDKQKEFAAALLGRFETMMGLTPEKLKERGIVIHRPEVYPTGFCWGSMDHVRLAVEATREKPIKVIQNGMHEFGHLVYLMALNENPPRISGQPVGQVNGYGLHEVSAMFFESAGQKKKFFELAAPEIRRRFGVKDDDPAWSAENLYKNANRPSLDSMEWGGCELSLMPQMAWRTLAERRILDNQMTVAELSAFRTRTLARMTGLPEKEVDDPSQVFDSSHWAGEEYGYFYAYITGGIGSAMLHEKLERERGPQLEAVKTLEEYLKIHRDFMNENIYKYASLYKPQELLEKALGQKPSLDAYIRYLERGTHDAFGGSSPKPSTPPQQNPRPF